MWDIDPTIIEFRLEGTEELLWRSVEPRPHVDDHVFYGVGSGPCTEYEVVEIRTTYRKLVIEGPSPGGGEVEVENALSNCVPCVIVRLGS